jgi:hypothetical protein
MIFKKNENLGIFLGVFLVAPMISFIFKKTKIWGLRRAVCGDFAGDVGNLIYFKKNENLEIFGCV